MPNPNPANGEGFAGSAAVVGVDVAAGVLSAKAEPKVKPLDAGVDDDEVVATLPKVKPPEAGVMDVEVAGLLLPVPPNLKPPPAPILPPNEGTGGLLASSLALRAFASSSCPGLAVPQAGHIITSAL